MLTERCLIFILFNFICFSSVFDSVSMETEVALRQEIDQKERRSAVSEERALSDSEIKVLCFYLTVISVHSTDLVLY